MVFDQQIGLRALHCNFAAYLGCPSITRKNLGKGLTPVEIVFSSLHADSEGVKTMAAQES
jgi:hypothetical protein